MTEELLKRVFSPWVFRAALRKVEHSYHRGEWYDPAEWLDWQHRPWENLSALANELVEQRYTPGPFPLVPYPKKGSRTRHYVVPSVKDQVAFMVFMVLLGPFLEIKMENVSFGNRLFRRRYLKDKDDSAQDDDRDQSYWAHAPFSLHDRQVYEPFSRGYGLYRRLAQWITTQGVFGESGSRNVKEDAATEDPDRLPYRELLKGNHWPDPTDLAYARLDLSLAYPSVDRDRLGELLVQYVKLDLMDLILLEEALEPPRLVAGDHPWMILKHDTSLRVFLATWLGDLVKQIRYAPWDEPHPWNGDAVHDLNIAHRAGFFQENKQCTNECLTELDPEGIWPYDCHLDAEVLTSQQFGIPTGLIISGWLLNVCLTPLDKAMYKPKSDVAYLRFVDDMILISPSSEALHKSLEELRVTLCQVNSQFRLNIAKAQPESVKRYLQEDVWNYSRADLITRANVGQFVTTVVQEMSEAAEEAIDEVGGTLAVEHLEDLMDLVNRAESDHEVADDARSSFAINRIARATWPETDIMSDGRVLSPAWHLEKILQDTEAVLRQHPHRYRLWRAILVIAVRAHLFDQRLINQRSEESPKERGWLEKHVLPLLRWGGDFEEGRVGGTSDPNTSDELDSLHQCECLSQYDPQVQNELSSALEQLEVLHNPVEERRHQHRRLRVSFLRACFWREWAWLVKQLQNAITHGGSRSPWVQAIQRQGDLESALEWLSDFGKWARKLYPDADTLPDEYWPHSPFFWWWEAEAVRMARLAIIVPKPALLSQLGNPSAGALRRDFHPVDRKLYEHDSGKDMRLAFARLFRYKEATPTDQGRERAGTSELALLWTKYLGSSRLSQEPTQAYDAKSFFAHLGADEALHPRPETDALGWAALARAGLWDEWSSLTHMLTRPFDPPAKTLVASLADSWRTVMYLDTYFQLRRLIIAHGRVIEWNAFKRWFPEVRWTDDRHRAGSSFAAAMYDLGRKSDSDFACHIAPSLVPELGLPFPVAWKLIEGLAKGLHSSKSKTQIVVPETVVFSEETDYRCLTYARGHLFDKAYSHGSHPTDLAQSKFEYLLQNDLDIRVRRLRDDDPAPHPIFLLPGMLHSESGEIAAAISWQLGCIFLWLISGSEHILDELYRTAPWQLSLKDRDDLRARYLIASEIWESVQNWLEGESTLAELNLPMQVNTDWRMAHVALYDTESSVQSQWDVLSDATEPDPFAEERESDRGSGKYGTNLRVRLIQIAKGPKLEDIVRHAEEHTLQSANIANQELLSEITEYLGDVGKRARVLEARGDSPGSWHDISKDHLVILPEFTYPAMYLSHLRRFVQQTDVAVLAGLLPQEARRAAPATASVKRNGPRLFINEAVFIYPGRLSQPYRRTTRAYVFRLRKSYHSAMELGLTEHLSDSTADTSRPNDEIGWAPGMHWYRFSHLNWGSFTVALCSDILDTEVWHHLRGRIQHVFLIAWNQDVDLFDQITWTRGYELYSNVVLVNHGSSGGSLAWSPKRRHKRELLRLRGSDQSVAVTVSLPIKELVERQKRQLHDSVKEQAKGWWSLQQDQERGTEDKSKEYKTPSPRYRQR